MSDHKIRSISRGGQRTRDRTKVERTVLSSNPQKYSQRFPCEVAIKFFANKVFAIIDEVHKALKYQGQMLCHL